MSKARRVKAEKQLQKDSGIVFKSVVGQEDYIWLTEWLMKNKEKEIEEAGKKHRTKLVRKLKDMSAEDYLFCYFNDPEIEERLKKEPKRLSFILLKLKAEHMRLQRTRI